jgi:hypothetical protein
MQVDWFVSADASVAPADEGRPVEVTGFVAMQPLDQRMRRRLAGGMRELVG